MFDRSPVNPPLLALWVIDPSLRSLTYNLCDEEYGEEVPWPPELMQPEEHMLGTVLAKLRLSSPKLGHLRLAVEEIEWDVRLILPLTSPRSLDLEYSISCNTNALRSLAGLPHLHTLYLPEDITGEARPVPGGFVCLEYLRLCGGAEDMRRAVETIAPSRLRHLSLCVYDFERTMHLVLGPTSERCSGTLTRLTVECFDAFKGFPRVSDVLRPLFCARSIQDLKLSNTRTPLECRDADLVIMAKRWPMLQSLKLECDLTGELPTPQGIAQMRKECSGLRTVTLRLDRAR